MFFYISLQSYDFFLTYANKTKESLSLALIMRCLLGVYQRSPLEPDWNLIGTSLKDSGDYMDGTL